MQNVINTNRNVTIYKVFGYTLETNLKTEDF